MSASMTPDQAHAYRTARGNEARHLHRKSKHELLAIYQSECGGLGGGDWSKQDLESTVLASRYPLALENEAIHVLYHVGVMWDGCELCRQQAVARVIARGSTPEAQDMAEGDFGPGAPFAAPEYEPDDGEAQRIAEVYADARAEQDRDWPPSAADITAAIREREQDRGL